jgi:hypothetical protein
MRAERGTEGGTEGGREGEGSKAARYSALPGSLSLPCCSLLVAQLGLSLLYSSGVYPLCSSGFHPLCSFQAETAAAAPSPDDPLVSPIALVYPFRPAHIRAGTRRIRAA